MLITLPAPDDLAYRAVPVAVRTALPVPVASTPGSGEFAEGLMFGEGDVEELVLYQRHELLTLVGFPNHTNGMIF